MYRYHTVDLIHSVAITQTEPTADIVVTRTWPLSFSCISVWLILSYGVLWHCDVFFVLTTLFSFGMAWVITEPEHHLETWRGFSWKIVDRSSSNIVVYVSVVGEYSEQGCVALSWHSIIPLVWGILFRTVTYQRFLLGSSKKALLIVATRPKGERSLMTSMLQAFISTEPSPYTIILSTWHW